MQELLKITTNEQGSQVVSARELYNYLGYDSSHWKKWYQKNVENNPFALHGIDWEVFALMANTQGGRPSKDFVITLDFAKRLSMMARTEKGEEARNYFIECEKRIKPKSQIDALLESVQILAEQDRRLTNVESKLAEIEETRNKSVQELLLAERSEEPIPEESMRAKIRRLINQYCHAKNADQRSVWHVIYDRLYYRYGINLRAVVKKKNESTLEVAEKLGYLDKIFAICSAELI